MPAGTGDDTAARYAVASLTAHLSGDSGDERKREWEQQCIRFLRAASDREVSSFFMKQLNLTGSDAAIEVLRENAARSWLCDDAVMALQAIGSEAALAALSDVLQHEQCRCSRQLS